MDITTVNHLATIIGVTITVLAFCYTSTMGVIEYRLQGAQKRAEQFIDMRRRYKETEAFKQIRNALDSPDGDLTKIPYVDKIDFMGFFEEIAILVNGNLIKRDVAHYMFASYAIRFKDHPEIASGIDWSDIHLQLFVDFVEQMRVIESSFQFDRAKFKL